MLVVFFIILVFYSPSVEPCGISTHIEVSKRAAESFKYVLNGVDLGELLRNHEDALQAGSPYPDAYYPDLCRDGKFNRNSEDTHWVGFLRVAADYIHERYTTPWNEDVQKLVVFLMAVAQHQVADVTWHGLKGFNQGFLRVMGNINYHGSFDEAHGDGDFGGDVVNIFSLNMSYVGTTDKWYVPVDDLVEIYYRYYKNTTIITRDVVLDCTELLYLGRLGEHLGVIEELFVDYAKASPFLVDRIQDYFLGGIDDMALWSTYTWKRFAFMIANGSSVCQTYGNDPQEDPMKLRCKHPDEVPIATNKFNELEQTTGNAKNHKSETPKVTGRVKRNDIEVIPTGRGVKMYPSPSFTEKLNNLKQVLQASKRSENPSTNSKNILPSTIYTGSKPHARVGEALTSGDVNNDGYPDLVIGASHYSTQDEYQNGRVYIINGNKSGFPVKNLDLETHSSLILNATKRNGQFGKALCVLDFNGDGFNDLAVGSPMVKAAEIEYTGEVEVFFGGSNKPLEVGRSVTVSCENERYCLLGSSMKCADVNGDGIDDLLLGAPYTRSQSGAVYLVSGRRTLTDGEVLSLNNSNLFSIGKQKFGWNGFSLAFNKKTGTLAVGSPSYRKRFNKNVDVFHKDDEMAVGSVTVFDSCCKNSQPISRELTGSYKFAQLGYEIAMGMPFNDGTLIIAVSSPTHSFGEDEIAEDEFDHAGLLTLYNSTSGAVITMISGDREFGRFGSTMEFSDLNQDGIDDLIVSSSLRTEDLDHAEKVEEGRVFVFYGGESFPRGNATMKCDETTRRPCLTEKADVVLTNDEEKSRFGSAVAVAQFESTTQLVISAPYSNSGSRLSGKLAIFNFDKKIK